MTLLDFGGQKSNFKITKWRKHQRRRWCVEVYLLIIVVCTACVRKNEEMH